MGSLLVLLLVIGFHETRQDMGHCLRFLMLAEFWKRQGRLGSALYREPMRLEPPTGPCLV